MSHTGHSIARAVRVRSLPHYPAGRWQRRANVVALVGVCLIPLLGFAALAIDMGLLYTTRAELQRNADAAALAAATGLASDGLAPKTDAGVTSKSVSRATKLASMNPVFVSALHLRSSDVEFGIISNLSDPASAFVPALPSAANAVRVTSRRSAGSTDGPVPLFFAAALGKNEASVAATATAVLDDRFIGYRVREQGVLLPFTIYEPHYAAQLAGGTDNYSYSNQSINKSADGTPEVWLFPEKQKGNVTDFYGAGNFGALAVGIGNGTSAIADQITTGITTSQMTAAVGSPEIDFYTSNGAAVTHPMSGNPGLSSGMTSALDGRIGQVVGFFVHSDVVLNGNNATYTLSGVRFGRLMAVNMTGNPKAIVIQPVSYSSLDVITGPGGPSTHQVICSLRLAR